MTSIALPLIKPPTPVSRRWLGFCLATVVLHLLVLQWAVSRISLPERQAPAERTVEISLRPKPLDSRLEQVEPKPVAVLAPALARPQPKPATKPAAETITVLSSQALTAAADSVAAPAPTGIPEAAPKQQADTAAAEAAAEAPPAKPAPEQARPEQAPQYTVAPPPSARLTLELSSSKPGQANPYYGEGEINWEVAGGKYKMTTKAGLVILFASVNLLSLHSEGAIDDSGIAPRIISETRRGRSETATHFHREEKTISFSASSKTLPLSDGAQDKSTIGMQLAGIGYADPSQIQPGREFAIQIAEERDATVFRFVVEGQEQITTKLGSLTTWHLVRPPRPGSYNSRLDIWLAPELQWYPVQIRNTESNGAVTTQTVTKITQKITQEN
ncbi:MAG: DUF3108 domain-containing protein [Pseudomonadota bacterium]